MLSARERLTPADLANLREVSELRFAIDLAPEAFSGYLKTASDGHYLVRRLPAKDDPMMIRVRRLRERDLMLIDTLNEHYANFGDKMDDSYESWRKYSYEEVVAYNELKRSANIQKALGVVAVLGGIAAASSVSTSPIALSALPYSCLCRPSKRLTSSASSTTSPSRSQWPAHSP